MNKRNADFFQIELQKDNQRFEQLKRVQENIEKNAIGELKHIEQIKKKIKIKENKANKQKILANSEREKNKNDSNFKFQEAVQRRTAIEKQSET